MLYVYIKSFHSIVKFIQNNHFSVRLQKKCKDFLTYWGARMPQISHAFPRCNKVTDLSESVHARWTHTGGTKLSAGQCVLLDLTEAIQSQVSLISLIPHHVMCMNIFNRERLTFCSRGKTPTSPGSFLLRIRFST